MGAAHGPSHRGKPRSFRLLLLFRQFGPGFNLCIPTVREFPSLRGFPEDAELRCLSEGSRAAVVRAATSHGIDADVGEKHIIVRMNSSAGSDAISQRLIFIHFKNTVPHA